MKMNLFEKYAKEKEHILFEIQHNMNWSKRQLIRWWYESNPLLAGLSPSDATAKGKGLRMIKLLKDLKPEGEDDVNL